MVPHGVLQHIRRFYYETALSPSPYAMAALRELVEPNHLLFGSDYPFVPQSGVGMETSTLEKLTVLDDVTKTRINRAHALELFPQFASAPHGDDEASLKTRAKRLFVKPLAPIEEPQKNR